MLNIITKKRDGGILTKEQISFFIHGYVAGKIPDVQAAALMMAIYLNGMGEQEVVDLTLELARCGDTVDLSGIPGIKLDKHSTGGVGDKTTLIVAPLAASLGVPVAKMAGRSIGRTGGTLDKLESIPGFRTALTEKEFLAVVKDVGVGIASPSGSLVQTDGKLHALLDMTATMESIALLSASIMSNEIASGANAVVLDVKAGNGAFMKTPQQARVLATELVRIGENVGRSVVAFITNMDVPLGRSVGNSIEVIEAVNTLRGRGSADLTLLSVELAANMLLLAGKGDLETCRQKSRGAIEDGSGFAKLLELVQAQGGDVSYLTHLDKIPKSPVVHEVKSTQTGYIQHMNCQQVGAASMLLGSGRKTRQSTIDYTAGIVLLKKTGEKVDEGEPVARLLTSNKERLARAEEIYLSALTIGDTPPEKQTLIYGRLDKNSL